MVHNDTFRIEGVTNMGVSLKSRTVRLWGFQSPARHPMHLPGVQQQAHQGRRMAAGCPSGYGSLANPDQGGERLVREA